jgi:CheY-like chemotaxis protein
MAAVIGVARERRCLAGVRVLVVDDDEDVRDALLSILQLYGADGEAVEGAADARERLAAEHFDVLLSDIEMPYENGYDFIRSVRRSAHEIAAAAVTARNSTDERLIAIAAGFDDVIAKPLDVGTLVAAVRELAFGVAPRS